MTHQPHMSAVAQHPSCGGRDWLTPGPASTQQPGYRLILGPVLAAERREGWNLVRAGRGL